MRFIVVLVVIAGLAVGAAGRYLQSASAMSASQATTSAPAPFATPSTEPSVAPSPPATPGYHFVYVPTPSPDATPFAGPGGPEIREIDLGDQTLVTPGEVRVRVLTSREVVSVVARTLGREVGIPRQAPGEFALDTTVGRAPRFLRNQTFDVDFVAAVPDGRTATVTLLLGLK